jgi:hypothetical protein
MALKTKKEIIGMSGGVITANNLKKKIDKLGIRAQGLTSDRAGLYDAAELLALFGLTLLEEPEPEKAEPEPEPEKQTEPDEPETPKIPIVLTEPADAMEVFVVKPFSDTNTGASYGYGDIVTLTYERIRELNTHPFGPFVWEPRAGEYGVVKAFSYGNKWYDAGAIVSAEALRYADESIMCKVWRGAV